MEWDVKAITNSGALSNVNNDLQGVKTMLGTVYSTSNLVDTIIDGYFEVCSLTLPTDGNYLVIGHAALSIADQTAIENLNILAGNQSLVEVKTTAASGGGLNASIIAHCTANTKLWIQCYGYSRDTSCKHYACLQALKLSD